MGVRRGGPYQFAVCSMSRGLSPCLDRVDWLTSTTGRGRCVSKQNGRLNKEGWMGSLLHEEANFEKGSCRGMRLG